MLIEQTHFPEGNGNSKLIPILFILGLVGVGFAFHYRAKSKVLSQKLKNLEKNPKP
jgi:hypothetical protein